MKSRIYLFACILWYIKYNAGFKINVISKDGQTYDTRNKPPMSVTRSRLESYSRESDDSSEEEIAKRSKKSKLNLVADLERNKSLSDVQKYAARTYNEGVKFINFLKEYAKGYGKVVLPESIVDRFKPDYFFKVASPTKKILTSTRNNANSLQHIANIKAKAFDKIIKKSKRLLNNIVKEHIAPNHRAKLFRIIETETSYKYLQICKLHNICRSTYLFSSYIKDLLREFKACNTTQLEEIFISFALEFQRLDLRLIAKGNIEEMIKYYVMVYSSKNRKTDLLQLIAIIQSGFVNYTAMNNIVKIFDNTIKFRDNFLTSKWNHYKILFQEWIKGRPIDIRYIIKGFLETAHKNSITAWDDDLLNNVKIIAESIIANQDKPDLKPKALFKTVNH